MPEAEEARRIVERAEPDIRRAIETIREGRALPPTRNNLYDRFMSGPVNPVFYAGFVKAKAFAAGDACTGCGRCINVCPMHAIHADYAIANELLNCKIAEYAKAVVDGRPSFHIALALDVSPCCDCHDHSDVPIVPNVGMFASFDPVALDTACADKINAQPVNPNSVIAHEYDHPHDHFTAAHPDTDWRAAVEHGEAIGLGTTHYELIEV